MPEEAEDEPQQSLSLLDAAEAADDCELQRAIERDACDRGAMRFRDRPHRVDDSEGPLAVDRQENDVDSPLKTFAATPACSVTSVKWPFPSLRNRWLCGGVAGGLRRG